MGKMRLSDGIDLHYGGIQEGGAGLTDGSRNVTMVTGASSGKFAVMSNSVHGSYDFYNNGTSYFNGNVTVDANLTISGTSVVALGGNKLQFGSETTSYIQNVNKQGTDVWRLQTEDGRIEIGSENTSWAHLTTDRASFYMNPKLTVQGNVEPYTDSSHNLGANGLRWANAYVDNLIITNDGSGSGIDADLLDGQQGSHYLNYNNLTNKPTIPTNNNQLTNGAGYVTASTSSLTNYLVKGGSWGAANMPGSRWNGFSVNGGEVAFLRDNPNTSQMSVLVDGAFYAGENNGFYSLYSGNSYNSKVGFYGNSSGHFYITTTSVKANGNTIWHAGNDGSGSGLDADLLDGTQKVNFVHGSGSRRTTNSNPNTALNSGFYDIYQTNAPTSTWYSYITMAHTNTANEHGHQIAGSFYSDGDIYNRHYDGTTASFGNWTKIWNAANDGSGSGLDADTLDGNHASAFLTDVLASSGLAISGSGSTRTLSMSGSYTGTFTLLGDFLPHANDTYDLGSTAKAWKELHVEDIRFHNASGAVGGIGQYNSAGDIEILSDHNIIFKETDGNAIRAVFGMNGPNFTFGQTSENTSYRVYVNGSIASTADVTAYASDERLKTNIVEIDNPIEKVKQLRGVTFDWQDDVEEKGFEPSAKHETGVIAQEVQKVIPDAVVPAPFDPDYLTVKHEKIVPLLIEAIKDQQKQIEYMKEELKTLKGEK